jgi:hypothetical protein
MRAGRNREWSGRRQVGVSLLVPVLVGAISFSSLAGDADWVPVGAAGHASTDFPT